MDHGEIAVDGFVESSGDPSVLFEPSDESFDDVSVAVERLVEVVVGSFVGSGGNDVVDLKFRNVVAN